MSAPNKAIMAPAPVGTRGTVGSLIRKEIEYFRHKPSDPKVSAAAGSDKYYYDRTPTLTPTPTPAKRKLFHPWQSSCPSSMCLLGMSWKSTKKQRVSSCGNQKSVVVVDKDGSSGFSYMILKDDGWFH